MTVWKFGCNWDGNPNSFFEYIKNEEIVIGYAPDTPFQVGDLILITEGYAVLAIAQVLTEPQPLALQSNYAMLTEFGVEMGRQSIFSHAEWLMVEPFEHRLRQGAAEIHQPATLAHVRALWEKRNQRAAKEIVVNEKVFEGLYADFVDFLDRARSERFVAFDQSRYVDVEENYKKSVFQKAREILDVAEQGGEQIGTGTIQSLTVSLFFDSVRRNGRRIPNNLFSWRKRDELKKRPVDEALERTLYAWFNGSLKPQAAYEQLLSYGLDYRSIAYLFFLKGKSEFLPIAQETFDEIIIEKLQIEGFRTSHRASWRNYSQFISIVRQTQHFLRSKDVRTKLLDAHSFLWILGTQRKKWLNEQIKAIAEVRETRTEFLQYWKSEQVEIGIEAGRKLIHAGSGQYVSRGVKPGDIVWIVTVNNDGEFILGGRIEVKSIVSYVEAMGMFDNDVFERDFHIVSDSLGAEPMSKVVIDDVAGQLRFQSDNDRLELKGGSVDGKQLQSIRVLTEQSATMLRVRWKTTRLGGGLGETLDEEEERRIETLNIPETQKQQLINARRGQGKFRSNLSQMEKGCRVTGVKDKQFLIASHIKPWRLSTPIEKLDGNNGLWLSPHVDKLFDLGLISFRDNGDILFSGKEVRQVMSHWSLDSELSIGRLSSGQMKYLRFHRVLHGFEDGDSNND
jgi:hypothetical protein